ncbi:MAG: glycosyltransferase family 4 protein [Candidatus Curtissbacteria bacterium]|nr:glycosyltransferase family 4 protein [Candidatus Curtissbacteria bacterium]
MKKKILFVYRTRRGPAQESWRKGTGPDSLLFGFNYLKELGYQADFFDGAYSPFNPFHPIFYPLEHAIISKVGMGFKLDQAISLLPKFNSYDVIVATGDSAGLPLLALKHYGFIKKPIIYMTAGLAGALKDKNKNWVGDLYRKILPEADVFTSYSQVETDFFEEQMGVPKGKIKFMPLGTDWQYFSKPSKLKREIISAVGVDSGRDYKTLFEAVKDLNIKVEVACHASNIQGLKIPDNVIIHFNVPVQKVKEIYGRSRVSIIPCFEKNRSAGQMVLLESASASLPIIASKIKGITGAFNFEDKKHLLFVKPQDSQSLKENINYLLNNQKTATAIGQNASKFVKSHYTTYHLAKNIAKFIEDL